MQLDKFNFLTTAAMEEAAWEYGLFIDNVSVGYLTCDIYQVFDFYVAFYYEINRKKRSGVIARRLRDQLPPITRQFWMEED